MLRYYMPLLIYPRRFIWKRKDCRSPRCKSAIEGALEVTSILLVTMKKRIRCAKQNARQLDINVITVLPQIRSGKYSTIRAQAVLDDIALRRKQFIRSIDPIHCLTREGEKERRKESEGEGSPYLSTAFSAECSSSNVSMIALS